MQSEAAANPRDRRKAVAPWLVGIEVQMELSRVVWLGRKHHGLWAQKKLLGRLATAWLLPRSFVLKVAPAYRLICGPRLRVFLRVFL